MRIWRGLDKSTIAAVAMLLVVVLAGWQLLAQSADVAAKRHQIDALIANAHAADHDAALDRATAAANQRALLNYTKALADRQDALLTYLRTHGIRLPERLVTVIPPPRIVVRHHRAHRHATRKHSRSTVSLPTGPGKSSRAPGHRKHRR